MVLEFFFRKLVILTYSLLTSGKRYPFNTNLFLVGVVTQYYVLNLTTLIFPAQGTFTVILFLMEFHLDYFILERFRSKGFTIQTPSVNINLFNDF